MTGVVKLIVETATTTVTIADKDGYSPDKLDDWVSRAASLLDTTEAEDRQ